MHPSDFRHRSYRLWSHMATVWQDPPNKQLEEELTRYVFRGYWQFQGCVCLTLALGDEEL